jgi:penicillin-binding protein A
VDASRTLEPHPGRLATTGGPDRRHRLTHRALPLALTGLVALLVGMVVGALHVPAERRLADRFGAAWQRGDYAAMHRMLTPGARAAAPLPAFAAAYRDAAATATATSIRVGSAGEPQDGVVALPVRVRTRIFRTVSGTVGLRFAGDGDRARIDWQPDLTFPGVPPGGRLDRRTQLPPRAAILARDGQVLAQGPERTSPISGVAAQVVGELGTIPPERRRELRSRGFPPDARVGLTGLERALDHRLTGTPGGTLLGGTRVLARATPRPGQNVTTTISPRLERAAASALAGRNGGVVVLSPSDGQVLAVAGIAYSGAGPPGSTFKLITTTAALEDHRVKLDDTFPVQTAAVLEGVRLSNANGESCGGTFREAFAESCNSVFAPLGVKVGPQRLVETAEKYGFNHDPGVPGAVYSTIPPGNRVGDDLAVGSTAIGQGTVEASALEMASIGATIANRGVRARPTILVGQRPSLTRVTSPQMAATLRSLMVGVVAHGTGTAAQIRGITVAGKTGTAELGAGPGVTDAWFVAFAPARAPQLALAVVMFRAGAGGEAAAPVAHDVLVSGLRR